MEHREFSGTWQEIWTQKGAVARMKEDAIETGGGIRLYQAQKKWQKK